MRRTHRTLLVYNYIVILKGDDSFAYMEWQDLKRYMSRSELMSLYNMVKSGYNQMIVDNDVIYSITGV